MLTYQIGVFNVDEALALGDGTSDANPKGNPDLLRPGHLNRLFQSGVMPHVEKLRYQVSIFRRPSRQKQRPSVRVRQYANILKNFVREHVDVQLVGDVPDELHEELRLLHGLQVLCRPAIVQVLVVIGGRRGQP